LDSTLADRRSGEDRNRRITFRPDV